MRNNKEGDMGFLVRYFRNFIMCTVIACLHAYAKPIITPFVVIYPIIFKIGGRNYSIGYWYVTVTMWHCFFDCPIFSYKHLQCLFSFKALRCNTLLEDLKYKWSSKQVKLFVWNFKILLFCLSKYWYITT